jgi:coenzyme Q-binding protein COQ10
MARHTERHHLPYTAQQLFDLVADVERYPDFLPWLVATRIVRREGNTVWVDMVIGTNVLRKRFASKAVLDRPKRIDIRSQDVLFERYDQTWTFQPAEDGGTIVEFHVDFVFRSRLIQLMMGTFLADAAKTMVSAFRRRARQIYAKSEGASEGAIS